jgi:hypothetical protein
MRKTALAGEVTVKFAERVPELERMAGRAHEIAKGCHVGTIRADTPGVYWQAQPFGKV